VQPASLSYFVTFLKYLTLLRVQLGHELVAHEEMASELLFVQAEGPELATRIMKMVLQILTQLSH
jgi:hypothetical protein